MINASSMANFAQISGNSATIYREKNGEIQSCGTYWGPLGRIFRSGKTKAANNAARSELLAALSDAYGIKDGYSRQEDGKIKFSTDFLSRLKENIGVDMAKTLKLDSAFEMKGGYVVCGKPLTERRISAVNDQLRKQLQTEHDKIFGVSEVKSMSMAVEAQYIEKLLDEVCKNSKKPDEDAKETALKYVAGEYFDRKQTVKIIDDGLTKNSLPKEVGSGDEGEACKAAATLIKETLAPFFKKMNAETGELDEDKDAMYFFCLLVQKGANIPDVRARFDASKNEHAPQFGFMPKPNMQKSVEHSISTRLSHLSNGHYEVTFERTLKGFTELNDYRQDNAPQFKCDSNDAVKNFYSYSCSYEFYVDEKGTPVAHLIKPPEMKWRFADSFKPLNE